MTTERWCAWLRSHNACASGYAEAHTRGPQEWWATTKRGDWMLWVLRRAGQTDKATYVQIAIYCAEMVPGRLAPMCTAAVAAAKTWLADPSAEAARVADGAEDAAWAARPAGPVDDPAVAAWAAAAAAAGTAAAADVDRSAWVAQADAQAAAGAADAARAKIADKIRELVPTPTIQETDR